MSTFPQVAPQLVANGYKPVPITPGTKAPTKLPKWQSYAYAHSAADDKKFAGHGVGVLTGDVLAVDIDVPDVAMAQALVGWALQTYGIAPIRVGNAPKCLLIYRAAQPDQRKAQTAVYKRGELRAKVEVLAKGQQFVAYAGPDAAYPNGIKWHGGDPLTVATGSLPPLEADDVTDIIQHCAEALAQWGEGPAPAQPAALQLPARPGVVSNDDLKTQRAPVTMRELIETLIEYAKADQTDYESWREVGAIIHHETNGSDAGLAVYIAYSQRLSGFNNGPEAGERGCELKWRSFGKGGHKPTTFGTLVFKLKQLRDAAEKKNE